MICDSQQSQVILKLILTLSTRWGSVLPATFLTENRSVKCTSRNFRVLFPTVECFEANLFKYKRLLIIEVASGGSIKL